MANWLDRLLSKKRESWARGYAKGYQVGSRESTDFLREMIIRNLLNDAVITTNADVLVLERVVQIVEAS
jgi:hypothetical protein